MDVKDSRLMFWDGTRETVSSSVEYDGRRYVPAFFHDSLLKQLTLPTCSCAYGSTPELFGGICKLFLSFGGLDYKCSSLATRIVLCSHLSEVLSVAPKLLITGLDAARANRLMTLLRCMCRHSLFLTGVTPSGFRSLPSRGNFTFLIAQPAIGDKLWNLLDQTSHRDQKIPFRGALLDLFGVQAIYDQSCVSSISRPLSCVHIPLIPTGQRLPVFDLNAQQRIKSEFQSKLLSYRRANIGLAQTLQFDASGLSFGLQQLACNLAAATPDDSDLQAEVLDLLADEDKEFRSGSWVDPNVVAVEAVLVGCLREPGGIAYVSELAQIAEEILKRRDAEAAMDPSSFGKLLLDLGFKTRRNAKGSNLVLTESTRELAQRLARELGAPEPSDDERDHYRREISPPIGV
jgi:hypothetical protein